MMEESRAASVAVVSGAKKIAKSRRAFNVEVHRPGRPVFPFVRPLRFCSPGSS
ncbi:UNVERIFIED_ORG: hypothetical protein GGD58_005831 [Rhizobium pisi]